MKPPAGSLMDEAELPEEPPASVKIELASEDASEAADSESIMLCASAEEIESVDPGGVIMESSIEYCEAAAWYWS